LTHDVVVVGGGIAGLAAAWDLRDLDVVVLEASERAGGRLKSERRGPYWLNFGAHVFGGPGTATDALLGEAGLASAEIPGALAAVELNGRVVHGGRVETYPFRLPLALKDRAALVRTGLRLRLAVAAYGRTLRSGGDVAAFHGDETFIDWLGRVPADVDALFRPTLERSSSEPEGLSAGYGIGYFHLVWDRSGGLARSILGGSGSLPDALAAQLPVQLSTHVREVAADGDGVRVVHDGGELRAKAAVLATPAHVTHRIVHDLPEDTRSALEAIEYGPYVVAAFLTNETEPMPWDGIYALAAARRSFNLFFNMASVLRHGQREPGGSLMVYAGADLARRLWDRDDARAAEAFVADIDAIFPGARAVIAETVVQRWEHGLPYGFPGRHRLRPALERDLGPLHLAGDYLGMRHTETAIATGRAAAAGVRRRIAG
jgi:protoporphyrinogen/coproporphyrinogen III oxidase